jgi:hypothetical protein
MHKRHPKNRNNCGIGLRKGEDSSSSLAVMARLLARQAARAHASSVLALDSYKGERETSW